MFHSIYSKKLSAFTLSNDIIKSWKGDKPMGKSKKKKPQSKRVIVKDVVEIIASIANIILVIYTILKG